MRIQQTVSYKNQLKLKKRSKKIRAINTVTEKKTENKITYSFLYFNYVGANEIIH